MRDFAQIGHRLMVIMFDIQSSLDAGAFGLKLGSLAYPSAEGEVDESMGKVHLIHQHEFIILEQKNSINSYKVGRQVAGPFPFGL